MLLGCAYILKQVRESKTGKLALSGLNGQPECFIRVNPKRPEDVFVFLFRTFRDMSRRSFMSYIVYTCLYYSVYVP